MNRRALALAGLALGLGWGGLLAAGHLAGRASLLDRLEAPLVDLRFLLVGPRPAPPDVVIVAIDEEFVQRAGRFPVPRTLVAQLVSRLDEAGARAIGIDLIFAQPDPAGGDGALAEAIRSRRVVLAAAARFDPSSPGRDTPDAAPSARDGIMPMGTLAALARIGFTNVTTDVAGTPRHIPLLLIVAGEPRLSFPLSLAALATGRDAVLAPDRVDVAGTRSRLDLGAHLALRFYGPAGSVATVPASRILDDPGAAGEVRDRVVLIGATVLASGDAFATPFDPALPGVEVLATGLGNLLRGEGLVRTDTVRRLDAATALLLPVATVLILATTTAWVGALAVASLIAAWVAISTIAFASGYWFSMALPLGATIPIAVIYGIARRGLDTRRLRRLSQARRELRRMQPPALADRLERDPGFLAEPVKQQATILFVDLTGFTGLAERIQADRTQDLLLHFHHIVDEEVRKEDGVVLTYMGDGAMAVFGLLSEESKAAGAIRAAMALGGSTPRRLAEALRDAGELTIKVGLHSGPVVVSRLGGESHQHITLSGDTVNVAARLQEVAAEHGALVACSEATISRAGLMAPETEGFGPLQDVPIRGRDHSIRVRMWPAALNPGI
jgi:adenylate cyclase